MTVKSAILTATLLVSGLPALAGGPTAVIEEPAVAAVAAPQDWKGLHFGLAAGKPDGQNFWAERSQNAESAPGDFSGSLPTASVGYDFQRGKLVLGAMLTVSSGEMSALPVSGGVFGCSGCEFTIDKLTTLRARVGWALGKTLVYATAGTARAHAIGTTAGGATVHGEEDLTGQIAGIGVERYVSRKITLSAEYLQTDFGRMELPSDCGSNCYTDVEFDLLQLGVNYRW